MVFMTQEKGFIKVTVSMHSSQHRKLKAIAAIKGVSLSTYVMECVEKEIFRGRENSDEAVKEVEALIKAEA